ncbi:nucleoside monophosphate kinase [Candidatus Saccharibacteria bacterium]|nr:nucleoside monophosphate kinase [Candidatus Saccharibacteria bacterium]
MIILFGLAGSGKSTQGQILAKKYGLVWLSVGQVLRDTGKFDKILEKGELVDDKEVVEIMNNKIQEIRKRGKDIILDGFPRDVAQAKMISDDLMGDVKKAIILDVPKDELLVRIMARGREDDTREAVERRFEVVEKNLKGILRELEKKKIKVKSVSGVGSIEMVTKRLERELFRGKVISTRRAQRQRVMRRAKRTV